MKEAHGLGEGVNKIRSTAIYYLLLQRIFVEVILCSDVGKKEGKWGYGPKESPHCKAVLLLCCERIAIDFQGGAMMMCIPCPFCFKFMHSSQIIKESFDYRGIAYALCMTIADFLWGFHG